MVSRCNRLFSVLAKKIIWQAIPKSSVDQVSRFLSIWVFLLYICSVRQQPPDSIHLGFPFTFWAILEGLPGIQITTKLKLVKKIIINRTPARRRATCWARKRTDMKHVFFQLSIASYNLRNNYIIINNMASQA